MAISEQELKQTVRDFTQGLPENPDLGASLAEGELICEVLEPLGLPDPLLAAVRLYPPYRQGLIGAKELGELEIKGVSELVEGLTQLSQFSLPADWQPGEALATRQSEVLRKMLLSVVSDPRLVLIRIAEQLLKLRRAKSADDSLKRALATETQEIYAPLANRLGVWQFKWELEDLAFRFLEPELYQRIARALKEKRTERESFINDFKATLQTELEANGIDAEISGRPKHIFSIYRKMQRKNLALEQLFDIRAVRILVDDVSQCYAALGIVHNLWNYLPGEFDDYIANPKDNDYRSLHTAIIGPDRKTVEVQIRTHDMHRHAELGVAAHWRYKEGGGSRASFDQKIHLLRQLLEPGDRDGDLMEQIRGDVFDDRVYALSPKGDVVEMPANATPLDFAYHVHTQVGHRCRGAKVNGRIVPLTYKVQNGDRIEIITGKEAQPSRDWLSPQLGYLASTRSRSKVRSWFRQRDKEQNKRHGRELLERELARLNIKDITPDALARQLRQGNPDAMYIALGAGDISMTAIASAVQKLRRETEPEILETRRPSRAKKSGASDVAISGIGDLMCNFARCCRPVPPESIVGYITQGRGVTIHRQDCGNFRNLHGRHPERVIDVNWGSSADSVYPAELKVHAYDRQGLIRDVSSVFADENISIESIQMHKDPQAMQVILQIGVNVSGLPTLSRVISRIEQLPNVTSVRRHS
ncbi:MAG: bifunctional (p)ppGpp synthetase/guanosine-3',5'-bis(diphosphate) 3'-pyrophosphohydrolase [Woeseiaceae bacterium]|nr:bifunctional (p)ppGpp synthetase/guanosine-3',5'-bis(diphosphate) 3'-pyrophosphohydrolase [Woeseiaceae bacterium]